MEINRKEVYKVLGAISKACANVCHGEKCLITGEKCNDKCPLDSIPASYSSNTILNIKNNCKDLEYEENFNANVVFEMILNSNVFMVIDQADNGDVYDNYVSEDLDDNYTLVEEDTTSFDPCDYEAGSYLVYCLVDSDKNEIVVKKMEKCNIGDLKKIAEEVLWD